jgi:single-strand DNA-binding protein
MAAGDAQIAITGNVVDEPELRFTQQGQPVARFRVASTPRYFDKESNAWKDGDGLFMTVNIWRQQAENVCDSITKGTRVVVTGRLRQRTYELKDGTKRTVLEVEADDVSVSLKFASAKVARTERSRPAAGNGSRGQADADQWATEDPGGYASEPPF